MAIFIEENKKIKNIFANINGEKKSIISGWVNKEGVPTKIFGIDDKENENGEYLLAPASEYLDWNYTLDEANNIITLNNYIGSKPNVIVYANYIINGKIYKTQLLNSPFVYNAANPTRKYMFNNISTVKTVKFSNNLDISNLTSINHMFSLCTKVTSIDFGTNFNTSNITSMGYVFNGCSMLTSIIGLNSFNTLNVIYMTSMFNSCSAIESLDLTSFNTSKVTNMEMMFIHCSQLKTIFVSNKWAVSSNVSTTWMFKDCGTSSVTYI